jgi:hypothetical protein
MSLTQNGSECAKWKTSQYLCHQQKPLTKKWRIKACKRFESADKVFNLYGIEVCPNISTFENKNLKMKMRNIRVPCHANFGYLLAGANLLTYFNF